MPDPPPVRVVPPEEIRNQFNQGRFWQRALAGGLRQEMQRDGHPAPPLANEPFCTRSQIIAYYEPSGRKVAVVHQYLRPDGALGVSGLPDPQYLLVEGVILKKSRRPD